MSRKFNKNVLKCVGIVRKRVVFSENVKISIFLYLGDVDHEKDILTRIGFNCSFCRLW